MSNYPPPERCSELSKEFIKFASNQSNLTEYQYFVDELEKLDPNDKHKFFYNIAQQFKNQ